MLECVVNISEGADRQVLDELAAAVAGDLLDIHSDAHHNRSVFTLVGEQAPRHLTRRTFELLDLSAHSGVHPRLGIIDVVPFVPLAGSTWEDAVEARNQFAHWVADKFGIPAFLYGSERTLPFVRQHAFVDLDPDEGPTAPHPRAGAVCVGVRDTLVAYNVWLSNSDVTAARKIAASIRSTSLRALGLQVGNRVQVSMNLINPMELGPMEAFDAVSDLVRTESAELVGLIPQAVLDVIPPTRWKQLDVSTEQTIEFRLAKRAQRRS